ncbi:MAG TPA: membrane protein insertase YidC [Bacteroidales bacterium]|nr:membrane protein insertase YidC [Bacteroidales bacterium]
MDKNTITGLLLIILILVGFSLLNKPSEKQLAAQKEQQRIDSIAYAEQTKAKTLQLADSLAGAADSKTQAPVNQDSVSQLKYGTFAALTKGAVTKDSIENNVMKLTFTSKGGRIASVRLKEFENKDSLPLILFNENESAFNFSFFTTDSRLINTSDLVFNRVESNNPLQFIYRLNISESASLDFIYTLKKDDYLMDFQVKGNNLQSVLPANTNTLDFNWSIKALQQEQGRTFEERYSQLDYKFIGDSKENLSAAKADKKTVDTKVHWVSFKDQFFTSIAICDKGFTTNEFSSKPEPNTTPYLKTYAQKSAIDFDMRGNQTANLKFYFGPIKYNLLAHYDKGVPSENKMDLEKIIPLGGKLFRWVNTLLILPMFNFFGNFVTNYGVIILLLTLIIKLIIFPFTWKSSMSTAKMRVLQPQIAEINAKFPGQENAAARSQATMEFYKRVGVSPMGGCLPMLFQMPILFAMFSFFPSSIELRHQSFLWAHDLSTYDVLFQWTGNIPLVTKYFGNHVSLFCLLMTVTNLVYTYINNQTQAATTQMPGMKTMSYMMPVMFLFMFNQYSAGLSLYFFVSTLITILQTYAFRWFTDEDKLLAQLNENKKKPIKKSGFAARLEQMQKDQQKMLKEQQNRKRK